jgi:Fe-S-cluster containining protein
MRSILSSTRLEAQVNSLRVPDQRRGSLSQSPEQAQTFNMSSTVPPGAEASSKGKLALHPCQSCGACCASFRVQFYWREAESDHQPQVPAHTWLESHAAEATEPSNWRIMRGTESKHHPRCSELKGRIGSFASCDIYSSRPTPCRVFKASYEDGLVNPRCDEARARHGLKALCKADWVQWRLANPAHFELSATTVASADRRSS